MPKIGAIVQNGAPHGATLSVPALRVLRALADGSCLTAGEIGKRAGTGVDCEPLCLTGLAAREELDLDGAREVAWRITDAGLAALGLSAEAGRELPKGNRRSASRTKIGALVPIFGSNRLLAPAVGEALAGCAWVGAPFVGGLSELPWIDAPTIVASDAHAHIINLARVVADPEGCAELEARLESMLFHPLELADAQRRCWEREAAMGGGGEAEAVIEVGPPDVEWAADYFVCAWMARAGAAGTKGEFGAVQSVRWNATGGDSVLRFRNAIAGLPEWLRVLAGRVTFVCQDAFEFLAKVKDEPKHGVYCDPPFAKEGGAYKHGFGETHHHKLAAVLAGFKKARVALRCYEDAGMRQFYPEAGGWEWRRFVGKRQTNENSPEALVVKN